MQPFQRLSRVWQERGTRGLLRFILQFLRSRFRPQIPYSIWLKRHQWGPLAIGLARWRMIGWRTQPQFSLLLLTGSADTVGLERSIASVIKQCYPHWELYLVGNNTIEDPIQRYRQLDDRIHTIAPPEVTWAEVTGDFIAVLDARDELAIEALYENARLIQRHPDADWIYSDEDELDAEGTPTNPFFKPDWSPDYFQACLYTGRLSVYRADLIRAVGLRANDNCVQDYAWALHIADRSHHIYHIPKILYHRQVSHFSSLSQQAAPLAQDAVRQALQVRVDCSPYPGSVEVAEVPHYFRVRRNLDQQPRISLVIPSAGKKMETASGTQSLLENCIDSILQRSTYRNFEIVIVDGYDIAAEVLTAIAQRLSAHHLSDLRLVRCAEPFNFSRRINQGAAQATGEILLLLNDDVEVVTPDWLESMLEFAQQATIAAVGAKLLFPDHRIQHTGIVILEGSPTHAFYRYDSNHPGYFGSNWVNRNYLAVTAACLMMRRSVFEQLGGMDETFPLNYNDVDLCLKAHQAGYRNVVTPYAQLIHYESISRQSGLQPQEWKRFNDRWQSYLKALGGDPYYNPNLSCRAANFELF